MITFLGYPKCSTSNKAQKWLDQLGVKYNFRPVVEERPTLQELREWYPLSRQPLRKLFNTSGRRYKELQLRDRLMEMSEDEQLELLASDGLLVKRPILVTDHGTRFGFSEEEWKSLLGI